MPGDAQSRERVDIWKVPLPLSEGAIARLKECLNSEERERSGKFRFEKDQCNYISARGALRTILGSYLNERPDDLAFGYGPYGKPFLAHPPAEHELTFNLSHCMDMAVIGVASCRRIGVDVETIRELPEWEHIVERHFSREERISIGSADGEARNRRFFHIWTRREAAAKARGLDLSAALSDIDIPLYPPGSGARFEQKEKGVWSLQDLQLGPSHTGAMCAEGETCDAVFRDFDPLLRGIDH
jgi:4'-phosphopantetheinyl transferase